MLGEIDGLITNYTTHPLTHSVICEQGFFFFLIYDHCDTCSFYGAGDWMTNYLKRRQLLKIIFEITVSQMNYTSYYMKTWTITWDSLSLSLITELKLITALGPLSTAHFKLHFYNAIFLFFILDTYLKFTLTSNCHEHEKMRAQTRSPSMMQIKAIPKPDLQNRIYIVHVRSRSSCLACGDRRPTGTERDRAGSSSW